MKYFAHIEVEFEALDDDDATAVAEEYAASLQDLPAVLDAWVNNIEEGA